MILPVLQEDMKVTTVQRAPRTCHDTESNFAEVWKSPTLRPRVNGEEWGGSDAAIFQAAVLVVVRDWAEVSANI